jgi:hypothetical protein
MTLDFDPAYLHEYYSSLSDEALLWVAREDLIDAAKACYDEEVARRGLKRDSMAADDPPRDTPERLVGDRDLVPITTFAFSNDDAKFARALLRDAGIPSFPGKEHGLGLGGLQLMVPASLAEQARQILETRISDDELAAQAEAAIQPEPEPGEDPDRYA